MPEFHARCPTCHLRWTSGTCDVPPVSLCCGAAPLAWTADTPERTVLRKARAAIASQRETDFRSFTAPTTPMEPDEAAVIAAHDALLGEIDEVLNG